MLAVFSWYKKYPLAEVFISSLAYAASLRARRTVAPTAIKPEERRIAKFIAASPPAPVSGKPGDAVSDPETEPDVVAVVLFPTAPLVVDVPLSDEPVPVVWAPTEPTSVNANANTREAVRSAAIDFFIMLSCL
jgi:hypothetical protein